MTAARFAKVMSANDVGATGGHQAGILVPKGEADLLAFFPPLDPAALNPDAWIVCTDETDQTWKLRYIYYNNRLHVESGTRNEYRLTHLTKYLRQSSAREGDSLVFTATDVAGEYRIEVVRAGPAHAGTGPAPGPIRLTGWRRVH